MKDFSGNRICDYPVGAIIGFANDIDPNKYYSNTTWEQIKDKFLLASGSRSLGQTGGEETHTLTLSEMPSHSHGIRSNSTGGNADWVVSDHQSNKFQRELNFSWEGSTISKTGGGQAHNNMPPFVVVNYWKRTE